MIRRQKTEAGINQDHPRASIKQVFVIKHQEKLAGFPYALPEARAVHQERQETISLGTVPTPRDSGCSGVGLSLPGVVQALQDGNCR